MKKALIYIFMLVGLTMCRTKEEKILKLDDLLPKSEHVSTIDTADLRSPEEDLLSSFNRTTIKFDSLHLLGLKDRLFPSRFGPDTTLMLQLSGEKGTVKYYRWTFSDSTRTINALLNWLDCFGPNCRSLRLGDEVNFQRNPMQLFVNDTSLIYIDAEYPDFENWLILHDSLGYKQEWEIYLEQGKGGKARWYRFEEEKKIKIETK